MNIVSFNVNGLRARLHQLKKVIEKLQPDVIGLQETKVHDDMFPLKEISDYNYHIYYHGQKRYSGVALLCREQPLFIQKGFITETNNTQKRVIIAGFVTKYGILTIINGYFPQGDNRNNQLKFLDKQRFYQKLKFYIEHNYHNNSLLLVIGDMNVSPTDLDIGIGEESRKRWINTGKCSFLPEEREWLNNILNLGLVDIYRWANPQNNNKYSWFDYRSKGFSKNKGLRIDLLLASYKLTEFFNTTDIDYEIRSMKSSSDHAPIWVRFDL